MLTFRQMEKYYAAVDLINRYETMIGQIGNGIAAHRTDTISGGPPSDPHKMEERLIRRERAEKKLSKLRPYREYNLDLVRETILEATARDKPSVRLKRQLLMKMRYERGMSWPEISDILKIQHPELIVMKLLEKEQNDT